MNGYLTIKKVAEELEVNPETVYRLVRTNKLKALRIGRQYRIRREDLEEYLNRKTR